MTRDLYYILAAICLFFMNYTMGWILVPLLASSLGVREAGIGTLVATPSLIILLSVPIATLSDLIGRRPLMFTGALLIMLTGTIFSLSESFLLLLLAMISFGFSAACFLGPALASVTQAAPQEHHARVQGYNGALQGFSALVGALLAGFLVEVTGFTIAFIALIIIGFTLALLVSQIQEPQGSYQMPVRNVQVRTLLDGYPTAFRLIRTSPGVQMSALGAVISTIIIYVTGNAFIPVYLTTELAYSAGIAGIVLGARNLFSTFGSMLFGRIVQVIGLRALVLGSYAIGVIGLFLLPWANSIMVLMILLAMQGIGVAFSPASSNMMLTAGTGRQQRALAFACVAFIVHTTTLAFPPLLGYIAEETSIRSVFLVGSCIAGACIILLAILFKVHATQLRL